MFFIIPVLFTAFAAFLSLHTSIALIASFFIFKKLLFGSIFLTCGLPTLVGAATFSLIHQTQNKNSASFECFATFTFILQFLLPLVCIILFTSHPIAGSAFLYSFYWFIPMILYFIKSKNIFMAALSSTFVAHAVGSILYLYATNMSPDQWLALIPVVAFERLVAAFGITFFYVVVKLIAGLHARKYLRNAL